MASNAQQVSVVIQLGEPSQEPYNCMKFFLSPCWVIQHNFYLSLLT